MRTIDQIMCQDIVDLVDEYGYEYFVEENTLFGLVFGEFHLQDVKEMYEFAKENL